MTQFQPLINDKLAQLNLAMEEITQHNSNVAGRMGGLLDALQSALKLEDSNRPISSLPSSVREYDISANVQEMLHSHRTNFEKIGIGLNKVDSGEIVYFAKDLSKLTNFVRQIPKSSEVAQPVLSLVARGLEVEFAGLACIQDAEQMQDCRRELDNLHSALSSKGLTKEIERSAILSIAAANGYLNEQLVVDHSRLLKADFPPHKWHTDANPKNLFEKWSAALETLTLVQDNPAAADLTDKLVYTLGTALEAFDGDLKAWSKGSFPYSQQKLGDYQGVYKLIKGDFDQKMKEWQFL